MTAYHLPRARLVRAKPPQIFVTRKPEPPNAKTKAPTKKKYIDIYTHFVPTMASLRDTPCVTQRYPIVSPLSFVVLAIISFSIMATKEKTLLFFLSCFVAVVCHRRCQGEGLLFQDPNLGGRFLCRRASPFTELALATGARMMSIVIKPLFVASYG